MLIWVALSSYLRGDLTLALLALIGSVIAVIIGWKIMEYGDDHKSNVIFFFGLFVLFGIGMIGFGL